MYNKVATQLHTYASTYYDASNVLNGNAATCMRTVPIGPNNPDKVQYAIQCIHVQGHFRASMHKPKYVSQKIQAPINKSQNSLIAYKF